MTARRAYQLGQVEGQCVVLEAFLRGLGRKITSGHKKDLRRAARIITTIRARVKAGLG